MDAWDKLQIENGENGKNLEDWVVGRIEKIGKIERIGRTKRAKRVNVLRALID